MSNEQQLSSNLSHNESSSITPATSANTSISSRKLASNSILDSPVISKNNDYSTTGFRYMDMEISSSIFSTLLCPECPDNLALTEINSQKKGAASASTLTYM